MKTKIFSFKKGDAVPTWMYAVYLDGVLSNECMSFATRGKVAVIKGAVHIWPAKKRYGHVFRVMGKGQSCHINGGGIQGKGQAHIYGTINRYCGARKDTHSTPLAAMRKGFGIKLKNRAKVDPIPNEFDRYEVRSDGL